MIGQMGRRLPAWAGRPDVRWRLLVLIGLLVLTALRLWLPAPFVWSLEPGRRIEPLIGMYPPEQEPNGRSFRWTAESAQIKLPDAGSVLLLELAAPHWQPATPVTISVEAVSLARELAPGGSRLLLLAPPGDSRLLSLQAAASSPPGDERLLGLKLYRLTLSGPPGWPPGSPALLLLLAGLAGLALLLRHSWPALLLPVALALPTALLSMLLPWLAAVAALYLLAHLLQLERYTVAVLVAAMLLAYLAASPFDLTTTNDGSHYALVRALGDEGRPSIDSYVAYAGTRDVALRDGHYYSDRPPGTALLSLPLYVFGRQLVPEAGEQPLLDALLVQNALLGALAVALLYLVCRRTGRSRGAALFAALAFGLGSVHWKYSGILYSHALGALLSILGVWLALHVRARSHALLLGAVAGYAVTAEYTTALLVLPLLLLGPWERPRLLGWSLAGLALGGAPLLIYNTAAFGHPLHTGYTYHATFDWARDFGNTFVFPLWDGLWYLLFDSGAMIQGLLPLGPVRLLAVPGLILLWRYNRRLALIWLLLVLPTLLLIATHRTFFGGSDRDPRYLAAILPLLAWPLAFVWDWARSRVALVRLPVLAAGLILLLVSVLNQMKHLAYTNGHSVVRVEGAHTIWNWRFSWFEFWWAALPQRELAGTLLLALMALLALALAVRQMRRFSSL